MKLQRSLETLSNQLLTYTSDIYIQATEKLQNRNRFLSMFSPTPGVLTQDMNSAFSYPRNTPSAMRSAFGGISSLAQMFPRAT